MIALLLVWTLVAVAAVVMVVGVVTAYGCHLKDSCTNETADLKSIVRKRESQQLTAA